LARELNHERKLLQKLSARIYKLIPGNQKQQLEFTRAKE